MTLLIKDANTSVQSISTGVDGTGNLVPVHASASIFGGVATPVGSAAPLPVINAAGTVAIDGSGTFASGGSAQTLFGGVVPANGYLVAEQFGRHALCLRCRHGNAGRCLACRSRPDAILRHPFGL